MLAIQIIHSLKNTWLLSDHCGIKKEINNRKTNGKSQNTWRLNSTWAKEKISREILKNILKYKTYQNLWDSVTAVLEGKFITLNAYITQKKSKISNLNSHHRTRKRKNKLNLNHNKWDNMKAEINETGNRKSI